MKKFIVCTVCISVYFLRNLVLTVNPHRSCMYDATSNEEQTDEAKVRQVRHTRLILTFNSNKK